MAIYAEKRIYRLADLKIIGKRKRSYGISAALFHIWNLSLHFCLFLTVYCIEIINKTKEMA